jgi:hypothetical protein
MVRSGWGELVDIEAPPGYDAGRIVFLGKLGKSGEDLLEDWCST